MKPAENQKRRAAAKEIGRTAVTGFFVGIGAIAPGISGGAIAVVFGLYDRITDAIAHFYRDFKQKMKFLIPLCGGAAVGVLLFSQVIAYLFSHYNAPVRILFIGLILGTLPSLFQTAVKKVFRPWYLIPFALAAVGTVLLSRLDQFESLGTAVELSFPVLLVCGAVLGFGTIVPGVSSSFILMAAGFYEPVMEAITSLDPMKLLPLALGFGLFVLLFAKLVSFLYRVAYGFISFTVAGLLVGSIVPVVPVPFPINWMTAGAVLLAIAGGWLSYILLKKKSNETGGSL